MYIFLDDERSPEQVTWTDIPRINKSQWTIVRNYDQFVALLTPNAVIEHVSFDHDLADKHYVGDYTDEKTGMNCAHALVDWCQNYNKKMPAFTVHSMNPNGKDNIVGLLQSFKRFQQN